MYTQQWFISYRFAASLRAGSWYRSQAVSKPVYIAVCTVKNCWWWTEELSETYRVLFQNQIWEISASSWFYYKNLSRCTVSWTSDYITNIVQFTYWQHRSFHVWLFLTTAVLTNTPLEQLVCHVLRYTTEWLRNVLPATHAWFVAQLLSPRAAVNQNRCVITAVLRPPFFSNLTLLHLFLAKFRT